MPKFKVLPPTYILSPLNCYSKKRLFEEICLVVAPLCEQTPKELLYALNEREACGSTICANEVGMPHAKIANLESSIAVLAIMPKSISYHTIDTDYEGVDIAMAFFFSPKDSSDKYEELLQLLYELFENNDLVNSLRRSWQDQNKLHKILHKIDDLIDAQMQPVVKPTTVLDAITGILNKLTDSEDKEEKDKEKEKSDLSEDNELLESSGTTSLLGKDEINSLDPLTSFEKATSIINEEQEQEESTDPAKEKAQSKE